MKRNEVYALIDGERDYQDALPPSRNIIPEFSVGDYLVMLRVYTDRAFEAWANNPGVEPSLDVVRKIAGIAVQCMEKHGAPPRRIVERAVVAGVPCADS